MTTETNFTQIRTLRQSGDLPAAYRQAFAAFCGNPDDLWAKRALAWVYADMLKDAARQPQATRLIRGLGQCIALDMPAGETVWQEQVLWSVCRFLLQVPPGDLPLPDASSLIRLSLHFLPAPDDRAFSGSLVCSVWLKALLKHQALTLPWLDILTGRPLLREDDFRTEKLPDGKDVMPLAERVGICVAREQLHRTPVDEAGVRQAIRYLSTIQARVAGSVYLPYYVARLWHSIGEEANALTAFMTVARARQRDFWVWDLLSELISGMPDDRIACLVESVSLGTPAPFLVKVRQKLAGLLIAEGRWAEARTEIEQILTTRRQAGWRIPAIIDKWTNDPYYTQVAAADTSWQTPYRELAKTWLWSDLPEVTGLVTFVDSERKLTELQLDARTVVRFPAGAFGLSASAGDWLSVRYTVQQTHDRQQLRILTAREQAGADGPLSLKTVDGVLRFSPKGFAFVGSVFVPKQLAACYTHWQDQLVRAEAVQTWDEAKQNEGWKAFRISRI